MVEVGAAGFQREVIERSRELPVVVDFWAPWCGPCRTLGPVLERLEAEAGGAWLLVKVNTDENASLARQFQISGIPAVKAFVDGVVADEFTGAQPESQVRAFLGRIVPDEGAKLARAAAAAEAAGDPAGAAALYAQALAKSPGQPEALLHAARRAAAAGDAATVAALLDRLRPADRAARAGELAQLQFAVEAPPLARAEAAHVAEPSEPAARLALGRAYAAAGRWAEALELFLGLVKTDRAFGQDAGRKAMLQVFDAVGQRSPLADEWRRKLSMELYK